MAQDDLPGLADEASLRDVTTLGVPCNHTRQPVTVAAFVSWPPERTSALVFEGRAHDIALFFIESLVMLGKQWRLVAGS